MNHCFLAKDVAVWIEHTDLSRMVDLVDEGEKLKRTLYVSGQNREVWLLTEDGLYEVLMQSRKPIAKQFKKKVKEILRAIRKHGAYMTQEFIQKTLDNPDYLIAIATKIKEEREARKRLEKLIEEDRPHAILGRAITTAKTSILIGDLAKILNQNGVDVGAKRLFEWMRNNGYLIKRKGTDWNMPTQRSMNLELFEVKESVHIDGNGCNKITRTTKVTGKGQEYFVNRFLSKE